MNIFKIKKMYSMLTEIKNKTNHLHYNIKDKIVNRYIKDGTLRLVNKQGPTFWYLTNIVKAKSPKGCIGSMKISLIKV